MNSRLQTVVLAVVFLVVGAFTASLWLEIRRETPLSVEPPQGHWQGRRIRVEVLNGVGVNRLAERATERLRELDFDVVYYGNLEPFDRDSSVAIARLDDLEPARRVADALGLHRVVHEPDRNLYLDVTVVLGADWAHPGELPNVGEEIGEGTTWWHRVKRAAKRLWPG
ncbi:MAG: LytR C-terminal domain-containing protein [Gemmatimonadota bacterium]|nr:MAG: LytR C-terminal domain-containing protein [Gemmatimonadota bacterium]